MIELPPTCTLTEAVGRLGARVCVWATPAVALALQSRLPWPVHSGGMPEIGGAPWLLAVGGGTLIDQAKLIKCGRPPLKLAALATLWGSGAEVSPIAVEDRNGVKSIHMAAALRPDLVICAPEFGVSVPPMRAKQACGDAWSHALEGFLSPLAGEALRADLAAVMRRMLELPIEYRPEWFELGALACAGQAQSGVGLVHGIAHSLEAPLRACGDRNASHAALCSLFLLPVMRFNAAAVGGKWQTLLQMHGIDERRLWPVLTALHDAESYRGLLPALREQWRSILRDPNTRTNSVLVRPEQLAFFNAFAG